MEKRQLNAFISEATRDLLQQQAKSRKCAQGDLVEAALLAFFQPGVSPETTDLVFARLLTIEEVLGQLLGAMQIVLTHMEKQAATPSPPPISTYEQMYGPVIASVPVETPPDPVAPATSSIWRWFTRDGS